MIKRELRYIRYRICRSIYYADQCPKDNRKNYSAMFNNLCVCALATAMVVALMFTFVLLA